LCSSSKEEPNSKKDNCPSQEINQLEEEEKESFLGREN